MKRVVAVAPYYQEGTCNFKSYPYNAWVKIGGQIKHSYYNNVFYRFLASSIKLPLIDWKGNEACLRFVEARNLSFDCFPDNIFHEVIPMVWDCWPQYDLIVVRWFRKYKVRTCIFTSSEAARRIQQQLPQLNILVITEGINVDNFKERKLLVNRECDVLSYGRMLSIITDTDYGNLTYKRSPKNLEDYLQNSKICIALPRCDVQPEETGGQETLTQRYWECMLSGMVMVGRSPRELIDLIGFDPVIPIDYENYLEQVGNIIAHIDDYQSIADRNRETALLMAPWEIRMSQIKEWLETLGYKI